MLDEAARAVRVLLDENVTGRQLVIIVLSTIELPILRKHLSSIGDAIGRALPGSFQAVDCGTFRRNI
jgi:hypothetical protein